MNGNLHPLLASSADPTQVSLTIKGALLALVPIIIALLGKMGVTIVQNDAAMIIENVFATIASLMMVYGGLRKVYSEVKGGMTPR